MFEIKRNGKGDDEIAVSGLGKLFGSVLVVLLGAAALGGVGAFVRQARLETRLESLQEDFARSALTLKETREEQLRRTRMQSDLDRVEARLAAVESELRLVMFRTVEEIRGKGDSK